MGWGQAGKKLAVASILAFAVVVSAARGAQAGCGDYDSSGSVGASDALGVLQTAVGSRACDKVRCDVDGSGRVTGSDALIVLKNAVGGSIEWACPAVTIESIDELPRATGPVADGASLASLLAGASLTAGAETGINFSALGPETFDGDSSMAACEVGNMTKSALNEAAQGDMILCYVQNIFAGLESPSFDIYDGQFHTFALDFGEAPPPGEGDENHGGPGRVRMRVVRDPDSGTITDFEMFACGDHGVGETVQTEYVRQTIEGPDFTMTALGVHGGGEGSRTVTVRGSLGDSGGFVGRKSVAVRFAHARDDHSGHGATDLSQGADDLALDGFDTGSFTHHNGSGTFTRRVHAEAELLDPNAPEQPYDVTLLAMGHGAAKMLSQGSGGSGEWTFENVEGWNGDTTYVDEVAAADFLATVSTAELAEVADAVDVVFDGETGWDCSGAPEALLAIDQNALDAACEDLRFGWDWVNCYDIIRPEPPPCEGEHCGPPCEGENCGPPCEGEHCPPPCEGEGCEPCEGPDCGPPPGCWDETCTCEPHEAGCMEECWNPECGEPPCFGPECEPIQ